MWAWPPILKAPSFNEKDESSKQNGQPQTHVTGRKTASSAQASLCAHLMGLEEQHDAVEDLKHMLILSYFMP